jgi:hypothetical protein
MSKYNFLNELGLSEDVVKRVSSNLAGIESGKSQILESPYLIRKDSNTILSGWDDIYKQNITSVNAALNGLEVSNRSKFGPRSIALPWLDRKAGVYEYFSDEVKVTPPKVAKNVRRNLRPKDINNSLNLLKNNTNSGLPFYTDKRNVKDVYKRDLATLLKRKDPCIMFTRTQEGGKTRTVWGYPMADTLQEMRYYAPLLDYQKRLDWRNSLISPDAVDIKMTKLIDYALETGLKLLSIDFSAYDQTLKTTLQMAAFDYIKQLFQPSAAEDLDQIAKRFNTIGLVTPDGVLSGAHGVPSGSTFTNEVDSICQYLIANSFGLNSNLFDIQGDDGAYALEDPNGLKDYFRSFGLQVNDDKSYVTNDYLVYLQQLFHPDYRDNAGIIGGIYPTYRALNRILYPERFTDFAESDDIKGQDYFSIRTICILENCKNHPLFRQFVEYVYSLDKYNLRYSNEGLSKFVKRFEQSSGSQGIFYFRREDNPKGLRAFKTVSILNELSRT